MGQMHRIRSRRHDAYSLRDRVTNGIIMICQTSQGKEQGSTKNRQPGLPLTWVVRRPSIVEPSHDAYPAEASRCHVVIFLPFLLVDLFLFPGASASSPSSVRGASPCCSVAETSSSLVFSVWLAISSVDFVASCGSSLQFHASESSPRTAAVMKNESMQAGLQIISPWFRYVTSSVAYLRYKSAG
jgi:hypothetical protein